MFARLGNKLIWQECFYEFKAGGAYPVTIVYMPGLNRHAQLYQKSSAYSDGSFIRHLDIDVNNLIQSN